MIECLNQDCDGHITAYYEHLKYVEFYIDSIDDDGSINWGDIYDIDLGDSGPYHYCDTCNAQYTIQDSYLVLSKND